MNRALRALALVASSAGLATAATITLVTPAAQAETWTTDNAWTHIMTTPGDGIVIYGDDGPENDNALLIKDYLDQPIFTVQEAGGAAVMGDQFRVLAGDDIYNAVVTVSPDTPPATCPKVGALWIGPGNVWKCVNGTWTPPQVSLW